MAIRRNAPKPVRLSIARQRSRFLRPARVDAGGSTTPSTIGNFTPRFNADVQDLIGNITMGSSPSRTVAFWGKISTDRNAFTTFVALDDGTTANVGSIETTADGTTLTYYENLFSNEAALNLPLTPGTWYYIALTVASGTVTLQARPENSSTWTTSASVAGFLASPTLSRINVGDSGAFGGEWLNGDVTAVRVWKAALTQTELNAEYASRSAVRTTNLVCSYELNGVTDLIDHSASGNAALTATGAGAVTEAGPVPLNKVDIRGGTPAVNIVTGTNPVTVTLTGTRQPQAGDTLLIIHSNDWYAATAISTPTVGGSATGVTAVTNGSYDAGANAAHGKAWTYAVASTGDLTVSETETGATPDEEKALIVYVLSGVDSTPVDTALGATGATSTTQTAPAVSPTATNSFLITHVGTGGAGLPATYTPPAGMTEVYDTTNTGFSVSGAVSQLTASGTTGGKAFTATASNAWGALSIAVKTAAGGSSTVTGSATVAGAGSTSAAATQGASSTATGVGTIAAAATQLGASTVTGAGTTAAAASVIVPGAATVAGVGSVTAGAAGAASGSATVTGTGAVAAGGVTQAVTATVAGAGSVTATSAQTAGASSTGAGSVTAAVTLRGASTVTGTGTVAANSNGSATGAATPTGTGTVTATAVQVVTAAVAGAGTVSAASAQQAGTSVTGAGTVAAAAVQRAGSTVAGTGTVTAGAQGTNSGTSTVTGTGTVTAGAVQVVTATVSGTGATSAASAQQTGASVTGSGSVTATVVQRASASATGVGSATANAQGTNAGAATVTGAGSVSAAATVTLRATATPTGAGTVTAVGALAGADTVAGTGTVTATATIIIRATATVTGAGAGSVAAAGRPKWVFRPNTGTTARPDSGATSRPFAGVTARP